MKTVIRIGSRESRLAVTQTEIIKGQIEAHFPHIRVEIVTMKTTGDRILDRSLEQIGGKGLFVKELDQALRKGRVDLSVHSLKDMPMDIPEDLPILAYSKREDPRDVLIFRQGQTESISGGMIGTSSKRRRLQLERTVSGLSLSGNPRKRADETSQTGGRRILCYGSGSSRIKKTGNGFLYREIFFLRRNDPGSRTGNSGSAGKSRGISGTFRSAQRSPV